MATRTKERQILRAAEQVFTTRRFHEVTMDDVRRAAGVGKGTIYRYFRDKDDLFFRAMMSGLEEMSEFIRKSAAGDGPFDAHLIRTLSEIHGFFGRRRRAYQVMQSEEVRIACGNRTAIRQRWQECQQDIVRGISDILRRGVSTGAIRKDIPSETMAVCLLAMLRSLTWQSQTGLDKEQPTTVLTDLFLQGAGAPAKAAERRSGDGRKPRRGGTIDKAG